MGQNVELITRDFGMPDEAKEIVVGLRVNGEPFDLPMGSRLAVETSAGEELQTVTVTLFADTVRYKPEESPT